MSHGRHIALLAAMLVILSCFTPAVVADSSDDINALEAKVTRSPDDADLRLRLARAYAAENRPAEALASCAAAAGIVPEDVAVRRLCGRYAEWAGDLPASRTQFEALLALAPEDEEGLLGAARAHGWSGNLERSARYFDRYLKQYPGNPDAWIEYARVRAWQGHFPAALRALEDYRERFGDTVQYREEKARYLAWDDRPREALSIITPLLDDSPSDYDRIFTRAVALAADHQIEEALDTVATLESVRPGSEDTRLLERVVRSPARSTVEAGVHHYNDSDDIRIQGARLDARLQLTSRASLTAGTAYDSLRADTGSGFVTVDGQERIRYSRTWVGGSYRFNPVVAVSGHVGNADIQNAGSIMPHEIVLNLRPSDEMILTLLRRREIFAPSPRSVSLETTRDHNALSINWRPDYSHTLVATASYGDFSDSNARRELVLAPRRAVIRNSKLNADLGININWLAFDEDLKNGYYDPESYQRYALTFFGYGKLSDDNGLSVVATAGFHKDDDMRDFEFGYDIVADLTLGAYRDWMTVLHADYSDRFQETGGYDGWSVRFNITRRF